MAQARSARSTVVIVITAVVALLVGLVAGRFIFGGGDSSASAAGETGVAGTKIDVITKATQSDFWQSMLAGSKAAGTDLGIDIKLTGPTAETDIDQQVAMVEDSITRQVDAIVLASNSSTALNSVIEKARDAGIKVIVVDNAVTTASDGFIGTDNIKAGQQAGEKMCELITAQGNADGKILHESAASGQQVLVDRYDGFAAGLKATCPDAEIIQTLVNDNDLNKAVSQVTDVINANPDLAGVFADNNTSGTGAARAVSAFKGSTVQVVAFDSDPAEVDAVKDGIIGAIVVQNPFFFGYQGVVEAAMAVAGSQPPVNLDPGAVLVGPDNVEDAALQSLLNPAKESGD
ncbi:sugar ABC transporter [Agromyces protaetiae]|uniref:Sugar ABC transporter n=1 Tax=Agromyces protaetiae TaxID=2509455 RepID=A0A4P6FDC8_9MICO|nr:ABC transporter substrate-binding protein [Agromyces protaetiae]QAY73736.1 sugar ABC transporter [Agromyces protaetiae]